MEEINEAKSYYPLTALIFHKSALERIEILARKRYSTTDVWIMVSDLPCFGGDEKLSVKTFELSELYQMFLDRLSLGKPPADFYWEGTHHDAISSAG